MAMQHSVFAIELCYRLEPGSSFQHNVRAALLRLPAMMRPQEKWEFYHWLAQSMEANLGAAETGCWDFWDDEQKAKDDFAMWSNGMITEEGARPTPSGQPDPYRGDARYLTITVSWLLRRFSPSELAMAALCKVPQQHLWRRATFARILGGMRSISFASVKADVVYLLPRDNDWGLTAADLAHQKFHYLRRIE